MNNFVEHIFENHVGNNKNFIVLYKDEEDNMWHAVSNKYRLSVYGVGTSPSKALFNLNKSEVEFEEYLKSDTY